MRRSWWRAIQWAGGLLIVALAGRALARNWASIRDTRFEWHVQPLLLVASALVVWLMYGILIAAWRRMLVGWKQQLGPMTAARIWTVSNLGKYVPGKVWAIAGMAMMAQQAGVAPWAATASAIVLQLLSLGTGAALVALAGTDVLEASHPGARVALGILLLASLAGVVLMTWPPVTRWALRRLAPDHEDHGGPGLAGVAFGVGANVVAWIGYGIALWLLARGLLPASGLTLPASVGAFAASYMAGFLMLIVPGGIGVREGLFILMLERPLGIGTATALALASRLLLTLTELGAAAPFLFRSSPQERSRVAG